MTSPVTVKHAISYHVLFSVEGQDSGGKPISGPGELRRLKVTRQVTFPSVSVHCFTTESSDRLLVSSGTYQS